jgi:hypothetical protein
MKGITQPITGRDKGGFREVLNSSYGINLLEERCESCSSSASVSAIPVI